MEILYLILPVIILLALVGVACLVWAIRSGQFEDMEGPKYRIFFDEEDDESERDDR
ncbi:MAG: cbb3-type cytochrome oxidase assembly protein CcoS [Deltaproteobacteria bacterium]|nr:cbb3-type cytochrome oxidase assembly protein CcoS [Deltaproteobacteria bacterium]